MPFNCVDVAPPPPPPLPVPSFAASDQTVEETHQTQEEVELSILSTFRRQYPECDETPRSFKLTCMKSLIQDGPTCGLAALSMISHWLNKPVSVSILLDSARRKGYSKQGEMFSARNMEDLSRQTVSTECQVELHQGGLMESKEEVLKNLSDGCLYLVPYDADKNHSPALLNGHKAHWAILCGLLVDTTRCFVLGKQSKSKHFGLWDFTSLHNSNLNLAQISPDKANPEEYVLEDIDKTLAGKFILFRRNT